MSRDVTRRSRVPVTPPGVTAPHPIPSQEELPPSPPASGGASDQGLLDIACPRCKAPRGSACVDRAGAPRAPHAQRASTQERRRAAALEDPLARQTIERYPELLPHQVHGAVATLRQAARWRRKDPELYADLSAPDLSPDGVRAMVRQLYKRSAVGA